MFGQTENCGLLSANVPKRYIKLGTTGKAVPGVKTKIAQPPEDGIPQTPMLEGGITPDIGEVSTDKSIAQVHRSSTIKVYISD